MTFVLYLQFDVCFFKHKEELGVGIKKSATEKNFNFLFSMNRMKDSM